MKAGKRQEEICEMFRICKATLWLWVQRFIKDGVAGLQIKKVRIKKRKLSEEKEAAFRIELERLQSERKGGSVCGRDIQAMLIEKFGVQYTCRGIYNLLKHLGFSWITGRSKHPKSNLTEQADFKKNSKKRS